MNKSEELLTLERKDRKQRRELISRIIDNQEIFVQQLNLLTLKVEKLRRLVEDDNT